MNFGILLHLYQPVTQDEATFKKIASECYVPLIKLLKNKRSLHLSLNIPLSLLEQFDKYGYAGLLTDLKELIETEKIEVTGSAAYHPLLTKLPQALQEQQIILNEYGLGYYFGRHSGFEGESAIMVKDLNGFFPPELALDTSLINLLDNFGYKWVLADETALPVGAVLGDSVVSRCGMYRVKDTNIKIVVRNRLISNMVSFKRDLDITDIVSKIKNEKTVILALDGECFGHHFKEGILLFETLIDSLHVHNIQSSRISDLVFGSDELAVIDNVVESTWGASDADMALNNVYPFWDAKGNSIQAIQWGIFNKFLSVVRFDEKSINPDGFETFPIWRLDKLKDADAIRLSILNLRALNSDQFWWASNKQLPTGEVLYSKDMIERSLGIYQDLVPYYSATDFPEVFAQKSKELKEILSKTENKLF